MCPFCLATAAMIAASATGTGGLAALVTGKLLRHTARRNFPRTTDTKEVQHGDNDNGTRSCRKWCRTASGLKRASNSSRKEKEFTRLRDELSRQRRELPWEKVEKNYVFEGPRGKETLADLFDGRSQLVIYHFMFGPGWAKVVQVALTSPITSMA